MPALKRITVISDVGAKQIASLRACVSKYLEVFPDLSRYVRRLSTEARKYL